MFGIASIELAICYLLCIARALVRCLFPVLLGSKGQGCGSAQRGRLGKGPTGIGEANTVVELILILLSITAFHSRR